MPRETRRARLAIVLGRTFAAAAKRIAGQALLIVQVVSFRALAHTLIAQQEQLIGAHRATAGVVARQARLSTQFAAIARQERATNTRIANSSM